MSTLSQRSFAGGEIAPALYARCDQTKYQTGLRTCRNAYIAKHGGAYNRAGTEFVAEVKDSSSAYPPQLIPFIFNESDTYVLEFGNLYMRLHAAGAQIVDLNANISAATKANPCVVTANAHGYSNGDEIQIYGVYGMTELNGRNFKVANVTTNTFSLQTLSGAAIDSTAYGAVGSAGRASRVYTITTPYAGSDVASLRYVQSGDVVTLVHPSYAPMKLSRLSDTNWTLTTFSVSGALSAPTVTSPDPSGTGGTTQYTYSVTAVSVTGEEGQPGSFVHIGGDPPGYAHTLNWTTVSGAYQYNIYLSIYGLPCFIATARGTSYINKSFTNTTVLSTITPPNLPLNDFSSSGKYPAAVTYYQQRLCVAGSNSSPETVWMSQAGNFTNFCARTPIISSDSITFSLIGRTVSRIQHMVDIGKLIIFTSGAEWVVDGDVAGLIAPTSINAKARTYHGCSRLPPLVIGDSALYVQARGSIVRDFGYDFQIDGYRGNDLTIFSGHLFRLTTSIVDWAYTQTPHSNVWAVRSDGVLLGLTYVKEQQIVAWHRHDSDGYFEKACVIPEGTDSLYVVVRRTINGTQKRFVERLSPAIDNNSTDFYSFGPYVDLATLPQPVFRSGTMTVSGGTNWDSTEILTLTNSASYPTSGTDIIPDAIFLYGSDGSLVRFTVSNYVSPGVVTGSVDRIVPVALRNVAIPADAFGPFFFSGLQWIPAFKKIFGLWHLEGKKVAIIADGNVVASPNNPSYATYTVTNGAVTLPNAAVRAHVGLPYLSDIETLDIDTAEGETLADKKMIVNKVTLHLENSRGIWVGAKPPTSDTVDATENLTELKVRTSESYDSSVSMITRKADVQIKSEWNSNGRVFIRQVDPLPMAILAVAPNGMFPIRGKG